MRHLIAALALLAAGSAAAPAHAERFSRVDGNKLVQICTSKDKGVVADCTSYLEGVSDSVSFYQKVRPADGSKGGKLPAYICVPEATTGVQMREALLAWAKANGDKLNLQASGVVIRALQDTYKCGGAVGRAE